MAPFVLRSTHVAIGMSVACKAMCANSTDTVTWTSNQLSFGTVIGIFFKTAWYKCLDLPGGDTTNGNKLWLWDCNGKTNQQWIFDGGAWKIVYAANPKKCIDVSGGSFSDGNQLQIWDCNGQRNQVWGYDANMASIYLAQSSMLSMTSSSPYASKCMDLSGGDKTNGNKIEVWDCNGKENQQWAFTPPTPSPSPPSPGPSGSRCSSPNTPKDAKCSGCPPMYNGKLCASTTYYNDQTKGSCGCGNSDPVPKDWWTMTQYTAALNCKSLDSDNPDKSWCPQHCGGCYKLCSTGGTTQGTSTTAGTCRVFKITNRCGDGYHQAPNWCSQEMSWWDCQKNPSQCQNAKSTNWFGYPAHFDLMDMHGQIRQDLHWDNIEVTFEPVACSEWQGPSWDCQCGPGVDCGSPPNRSAFEVVI